MGRARDIARHHAGPVIWLYHNNATATCGPTRSNAVDGYYVACFKGQVSERGNMTAILIDVKDVKYLGGNIDEKPVLCHGSIRRRKSDRPLMGRAITGASGWPFRLTLGVTFDASAKSIVVTRLSPPHTTFGMQECHLGAFAWIGDKILLV